eukprot:gene4630-5237_t
MLGELHFFVLSHIFSFLDHFEKKSVARLVCKRWKEAAEDVSLWKDVLAVISLSYSSDVDISIQSYKMSEDISRLVEDLTKRRICRIQFHKTCQKQVILEFCKLSGKNIKHLSLKGCVNLKANNFAEILEDIRMVESLDLSDCYEVGRIINNTEQAIVFIQKLACLSELARIDLGHTSYEFTENYAAFVYQLCQQSPHLNTLGLSGFRVRRDFEQMLAKSLSLMENMQSLDFAHTEMSIDFLKSVENLPKLVEIYFPAYFPPAEGFHSLFIRMKNIKRLDMKSVREFSYLNCFAMVHILDLKLEVLRTPGCPAPKSKGDCCKREFYSVLREKSLVFCEAPFSTLKEVNLSDCNLSDDDVSFLCEFSPQLEILNVSSSAITDKSIHNLSFNLHLLKQLDISKCYNLTDEAFLSRTKDFDDSKDCLGPYQIQNWTRLKCFDFSNCMNITDKGLEAILGLHSLRCLYCSGCLKVTEAGLESIANSLKSLNKLNISKLEIDDDCLEYLTLNLPFLISLDVSWIPKITEKSLRSVENNSCYLRYLNISHCPNITQEHVAKFSEGFGRKLVELVCSYDQINYNT